LQIVNSAESCRQCGARHQAAQSGTAANHPRGDTINMTNHDARRPLTARRIVLLATASSLAAAAIFTGASLQDARWSSAHAAEIAQRPAGFADLAEKVKPAVISVRVKTDADAKKAAVDGSSPNSRMEQFLRRFGQPDGMMPQARQLAPRDRSMNDQGSGFFISADGFAVTNHHLIDNAQGIEVIADDGKTYSAKIVGTDPRTDIALIKVDGRNDFPYVKLAERAPRIGDWVLAVGNPFGLGGTITAGIVSARGRDLGAGPYDDFLQIDASVNKGNSGGPTFDMDGNVIGVNTAVFSPSGGSVGIAFDVPADVVKQVVAQLKDKGMVTRGWMGVQIQPVTADIADGLGLKATQGALVAAPQAGSPAATAGILSGDVITAVDGKALKDARDLAKLIGAMMPGTTVKLTVWRKDGEKSVTVTLGELPKEREARAATPAPESSGTDMPKLGLMLAPAGQVAGSGSEGLVVTAVEPGSLAAGHGMKTGDVILEVAGKKVATPADVRNAVSDAHKSGKRTVLMRLKTDETTKVIAVTIARA
jgi:serine protease Do